MWLVCWHRMLYHVSDHRGNNKSFDNKKLAGILMGIVAFTMILGLATFTYMKRKKLTMRDSTQSKQLDFMKGLQIIDGIAQGLLYLLQDSRLRIMHSDLKASTDVFHLLTFMTFRAWRLWIEEKPLELIDDLLDLDDLVTPHQIPRCIHVGLLCVQQTPENRPNMSSMVLMLNGEKLLPKPSQLGFYIGTNQYPPIRAS
ncbi:hypothetical protein JHK85_010364 [Glycine max]|nr:hypothetical protein JHK85_010364 [Glycine max]